MARYIHLSIFIVALAAMLSCNNNTASAPAVPPADSAAKPTTAAPEDVTELPVVPLHTESGMDEENDSSFQYPNTFSVPNSEFSGQLAAYGIADELWLAPKGWTGSGNHGADGNVLCSLHPPADSGKNAPKVSYYEVPACSGCALSAAALYFKGANDTYNEEYNTDHTGDIVPMAEANIKRLSQTLITYTKPAENGLVTKGAAYFTQDGDVYYIEASYTLPEAQGKLADFLIAQFIRSKKLE